jgi:hypothetical protein
LGLEGGEKMNKRLMKLSMILLVAIIVSVPFIGSAQACGSFSWGCKCARVTKVPASTHLISTEYVPPTPQVEETESVVHVRGINFINERTLTIGDDDYDVYVEGSFDMDWYPKTGIAICYFTAVWYVGSFTGTTDNGFSGNVLIIIFNVADPMTMAGATYTTSYSVNQGFGSFAQQTLRLGYAGPYEGGTDMSGYRIIP